MSTNKSIKIQKNKVLTYSVNKAGFKTIYGTEVVSENKTINVNMVNLNSEQEPFQLGNRLFGISSFVDYFTPSGTYDVDSLKYLKISQTTGTSLSNLQVVKATWLSQVEQTLSVETPKGTSNTFVFTYDGSNWQLSGATTQSNVDLENYGISFDGTPAENDVITVVETQYNRFAFFVLDANYRNNTKWCSTSGQTIMPKKYNSVADAQNCIESATYFNQYAFNNANLSIYPLFSFCKNKGNFILPNGIKINTLIPNIPELIKIWNNRVFLDSIDPIIQGGSTSYNLTNWNFSGNRVHSCLEKDSVYFYGVSNSGSCEASVKYNDDFGNILIFEVPVM